MALARLNKLMSVKAGLANDRYVSATNNRINQLERLQKMNPTRERFDRIARIEDRAGNVEVKISHKQSIIEDFQRSTCTRDIEYDPRDNTVIVTFVNSGHKYKYFGVTLNVMERWAKAPSNGRFFVRNIRNYYAFMRVG